MKSAWIGVFVLCLAIGGRAQDDDEAGIRGRAEIATAVERAYADQKKPEIAELEDKERVFGLPLMVVEGTGVRVLATGTEEEARRAAEAMFSARTVFVGLTGTQAFLPSGLRAYLLGTEEAKNAFLKKHPKIGPQQSEAMARLEGSGVPETADWAWWEGDAEKRLDGIVRISLDWLCRTQGVTTEGHAWLHEGLGFYLTHALVGTRLCWFEQPRLGGKGSDPANVALRSQMDEPGADWMALARGWFAPEKKFDLEELLHLGPAEMEPIDHLRAHALAGYLVEVRRAELGKVIERVGAGDDSRLVLEETLELSLGKLRERLDGWLERRDALVAKAEGRRTDAELLAQWQALTKEQKAFAVPAFRGRLEDLETQQMRWVRALLALAPSETPMEQPLTYFDPKVHAPEQPIRRKRLSKTDPRAKRVRAEVSKVAPAPSGSSAFEYDWFQGRVVKSGDPDDPEAVFQNALLGLPPGADLARATALAILDHPQERKLQAAFAHAYTDRAGNAYPLELFEMWTTGVTMEMPDVDTLGIVHEVLDEWGRWTAPVPGTQHAALYKVIGDLFKKAKRSRELRLSLADLVLQPGATPRVGYETQVLNLHALWAAKESDAQALAAELPDGDGWSAYLAELLAHCQSDYKYYAKGRRRAAQLRQDGVALRKVWGATLDEAAEYVPPSDAGSGD